MNALIILAAVFVTTLSIMLLLRDFRRRERKAFSIQMKKAQGREVWFGRVEKVLDGDTIILNCAGISYRVRLQYIDAPESNQAYGTRAGIALASMIEGRFVMVAHDGLDRYNRLLGEVFLSKGDSANLALVKAGMAHVYARYCKKAEYFAAEKAAKAAGIGLWADGNAVHPEVFRRHAVRHTPWWRRLF